MTDERTLRVAAAARECGADWAIVTAIDAVAYATGHVAVIEAGPSPFNGGPAALAVIGADGNFGLVVNQLERGGADATAASVVRSYESLGFSDQRPLPEKYLEESTGLFQELGVGGTVAVERTAFPHALAEALPGARFVPIDDAMGRARSTKTPDEIALLRECARITAVGHAESLHAIRPGRSELEIFADIRCAMEMAVGERIPLTGDLISGRERTAGAMGWPGTRVVDDGDPVICDLAPRVNGYWGDSCNTVVLGEATPEYMRLYRTAARALEVAGETMRPGMTAGQLDAAVRGVIEGEGMKNPLHAGHGVGAGSHEWPRIVPGSEVVLEPGMVLMCEPGAYDPEIGGVRLEWMFLVTENGNEVLSPFAHIMQPAANGETR
jgi:Xaa-Pro dipeptidase